MITTKTVDFQNTELAFRHLSDGELYRAWMLFRTINVKPLVALGPPLVQTALSLGLPIRGLLRSTLFNHFCGGESLTDCSRTVEKLYQGKVHSILDYGVEGEKTEAGFDAATSELLRSIEFASADLRIPFCVFKLTALGSFDLLERISSKSSSEPLSVEDQKAFDRVQSRVAQICDFAIKHHKLVMIDAEETWIQPAIDLFALAMMKKHNQKQAKVFTTIQMYRKKGLENTLQLISQSKSEGWSLGVKLVRGAYLEKERERAQKLGYESPIHDHKSGTDEAYNHAMVALLQAKDHASICIGTHNVSSCEMAVHFMTEHKIEPNSSNIWFAQLLGMSDVLSFNLANSQYNAAKYVPYGPIKSVLPYLFRRARENTSIAGQSGRELQLIEQELKRRSK